ncbi:MAG TPA: hypothetical protein VGG16_05235 [Streptosporangiaceae bacterium]
MPGNGPVRRAGTLPGRAGAPTAKGMPPRNPAAGYKAAAVAAPSRPQPSFSSARDTGFLGAPVAQVGVLTPPAGSRYSGPETVAWSITEEADVDSGAFEQLEEYWEQDEADVEYSALLSDLDEDRQGTGSQAAMDRPRIGKRRGRSGDRRLWFGLGGVMAVAAAAIFVIVEFWFPTQSGPTHTLSMPNKIGSSFVRSNAVGAKDLYNLRQEFVQMTHGQATDVQSGAFQAGGPATGGTPEVVMTIDAHLANDDAASSMTGFKNVYKNAGTVSAGPMGGLAACAESTASNANDVAICAWFDNDSFGVLISPSMNARELANQLQTFRSAVEHVSKS